MRGFVLYPRKLEDCFFELLCCAEFRRCLCRDMDLLPGLRVDAFARCSLHDLENSESCDFDLITFDHRLLDLIEDHVDKLQRILLGAVRLVHDELSEPLFISCHNA